MQQRRAPPTPTPGPGLQHQPQGADQARPPAGAQPGQPAGTQAKAAGDPIKQGSSLTPISSGEGFVE